MSDALAEKLKADGWTTVDDDGFIDLVGPLWQRTTNPFTDFALIGQDKHRNRRGVVQGGAVMTLADRTCGMAARQAAGVASVATVQLDTHFVDAALIGDLMISKPRVVRITKSIIFMSTEISVGDRCVATASGVFKIVGKPIPGMRAQD